jgi:hypothetical protein
MVDNSLLIAACHSIITATLVFQTKPIVIHKPDEKSRRNKLCIVTTMSLVAVGTNSLI